MLETLSINIPKYEIAKQSILSNIGFSIPKHSIVAIVGPNGAGKTTVLNLLFRPKTISHMSFKLGVTDLVQLTPKEYPRVISYLGASDFSQPILSLSSFFESSCYSSEFLQTSFEESLIEWQLATLKDRLVSTLSLGQFQRLLLAVTCYQQSELYMFDEPERHLDPQGVMILSSVLKEKKRQSKTILFATHDLNLALSTADYLVGINENGEQKFCCDQDLISRGGYLDDLFQAKFKYFKTEKNGNRVFT